MKPLYTITADVSVGIYDNCVQVARIYADKIVCVLPYVKWTGNTGGYAEKREVIRVKSIVDKVIDAMGDGCEDSAWSEIDRYFD